MKNLPRKNALLVLVAALFASSAALASGFSNDRGSDVNWTTSIECTNLLGGSHADIPSQDSHDYSFTSESSNTPDYTSFDQNYPCDTHGYIPEGTHISYTDCFKNPCDRIPNHGGQSPVPEPGTYVSVLTGLGLGVVGLFRRK
jgi:PEP-CTERM motif